MNFDLDHFIYALSDTVDLVGVDELCHGKRVACMAWKCAESLGLDIHNRQRLFHMGLLHDCGVSSTEERNHLVTELEWENSHIHCQIGSRRMMSFAPLALYAESILYHHTRWERLADTDTSEETRKDANLLYLLDRVDYLGQSFPGNSWLSKKDHVRHVIISYRDTYFNSELVDAFLDASENEAFWITLEPLMLMDFLAERKNHRQEIQISIEELQQVAKLFAEIVDAKSPYTAEHSTGVASLARLLAHKCQLDEESQKKIAIAALLHDLGKLQVPDKVLESSNPLTGEDLSAMRHHSYVTYSILHKIHGFEDIAIWAGNHHEALDGSGYPFRRTSHDLSIESRIIAIADMFQALAQKRPYRDSKPLDTILQFLQQNGDRGRIDKDIVNIVVQNSEQCYLQSTAV